MRRETLTQPEMARAFNEWMRRFIEEPKRFRAEFESVRDFEKESAAGGEPSYGTTSAAYMLQIHADLSGDDAEHSGA